MASCRDCPCDSVYCRDSRQEAKSHGQSLQEPIYQAQQSRQEARDRRQSRWKPSMMDSLCRKRKLANSFIPSGPSHNLARSLGQHPRITPGLYNNPFPPSPAFIYPCWASKVHPCPLLNIVFQTLLIFFLSLCPVESSLLSQKTLILVGWLVLGLTALWDSISVYIGPSPTEREKEKKKW